ncbi:unnamed protein product [Leuciscus chuanchicus]
MTASDKAKPSETTSLVSPSDSSKQISESRQDMSLIGPLEKEAENMGLKNPTVEQMTTTEDPHGRAEDHHSRAGLSVVNSQILYSGAVPTLPNSHRHNVQTDNYDRNPM